MLFKKGSKEGYTRAVVGDISKNLGILPAELKSIIKSTTIPTVYDELVSTYKLSPIVEDIGKARGRPTKESMLEIPITTPTTTPQRIQSPPSPAPTMTTPQPRIQSLQEVAPQPVIAKGQDYESISGTKLPESSYAEIDKDLSDAFNIASVNIRNPEATGAIIERGFMRITNNLFPQKSIEDLELRFIPTVANKALVMDVASVINKALQTKDINDIVEANRGFRKVVGVIRRGRVKGSGMKRKATKAGKPLAITKADKLRINLIIGEINAGNNNPMLLKEINKLKKKYSK
jgi:hypothetical protein